MSGRRHANVVLVLWMLVAIAAVGVLAYWDQLREADASLHDLADAQATLAQALSHALAERLEIVERDAVEASRGMTSPGERDTVDDIHVSVNALGAPQGSTTDHALFHFELRGADDVRSATVPLRRLLASLSALERPGVRRVLVRLPHEELWIAAADGSTVAPPSLVASTTPGARAIRLSRPEAAELGLPARTAVAGVARIDAGALGVWEVGVVTTAQVERDRDRRAQLRFVLGVVVATALVLAFGSAAVRRQKRQIVLTHALEIAEIERQRDERLVTANKLATMGALATGIAHEVATPLGVIVARAEQIVARTDGGERTRRGAEIIVAQAERIHVVIRGFLALARGHTPRLVECDPGELARAALGLVDHRFAKAGVALTPSIDENVGTVACDPRMFEQVLVNLLLNACDACEAGGTVELSVRRQNDRIAFVVDDDGMGIDEETVLRATEPFFTTKPEGTGLGLAITKEIVNHHGGSLVLRARPSGGTQALVEVPSASRMGDESVSVGSRARGD